MDLSGFGEFRYTLEMTDAQPVEKELEHLKENDMELVTFIVK